MAEPPKLVVLHGRQSRPEAEALETVVTDEAPSPELLVPALEAVLFVSTSPASVDRLAVLLSVDVASVRAGLVALGEGLLARGGGVQLAEVGGGWQLRTAPRVARWVARARELPPLRLSKAAVETLAIIAYRQPVTRQEVEAIRGVDSGGVVKALLDRGLLRSTGRRDDLPGRPLLYGTTPEFLHLFGLRDLADLPTLKDLRELQADDHQAGPVKPDP